MNDLIKRERERIARELHDRLGQTLTGLKLDAAWLKRRLSDGNAPSVVMSQRLTEMMNHLDASLDEIRAIAYALRIPEFRPEELQGMIESHARAMAARGGLMAFCDIGHDLPLNTEQAYQIFRIAQESITNILRHAQAKSLWISLQSMAVGIELRIRDDGCGVSTAAITAEPASLGLMSMQERAQSIGALLTVQPAPQGGTLVHLQLPHRPAKASSDTSSSTYKGN